MDAILISKLMVELMHNNDGRDLTDEELTSLLFYPAIGLPVTLCYRLQISPCIDKLDFGASLRTYLGKIANAYMNSWSNPSMVGFAVN